MRVRQHLSTVAVLTLSAQILLAMLGTARVCWAGEHRHGGVVVADCAMHHHGGAPYHAEGHAHHHTTPPADDSRASLTCGCSTDVPGMLAGLPGVMPVPVSIPAPAIAGAPAAPAKPSVGAGAFPPLSPPPRTLVTC